MTVLSIEEHGEEITSNKVLLFRITSTILLVIMGFIMINNLLSVMENENNFNILQILIPIVLAAIIYIMYYYQHKWSEEDNKEIKKVKT